MIEKSIDGDGQSRRRSDTAHPEVAGKYRHQRKVSGHGNDRRHHSGLRLLAGEEQLGVDLVESHKRHSNGKTTQRVGGQRGIVSSKGAPLKDNANHRLSQHRSPEGNGQNNQSKQLERKACQPLRPRLSPGRSGA